MKIQMPQCQWCGTYDPFMCKVCGRFTCRECVLYPAEGECVHAKYETPKIPKGWYVESNE